MKTQQEQIEFATSLQDLTAQHGKLIDMLEDASDKNLILDQIQSILSQINELRNSYMSEF